MNIGNHIIQKTVDILRMCLILSALCTCFTTLDLFPFMKEYLIKEISNKPIILRQTKKLKSQLPRLIKDNEGRLVLYTDNISKFTNKKISNIANRVKVF